MDKRKHNQKIININIQVNVNTQNPVQGDVVNKSNKTKNKKSFLSKMVGKLKTLVEFLGSIDPNIIITLIAMMFGIRL